jgi:ADP-dependent NAD(P)H-hydrate dehydratase / NAD(P)H-hydrate epimerase
VALNGGFEGNMKVVTGQQMAKIDRTTIDELGMPGSVLMENAARLFCRAFVEFFAGERLPILVLCGSGNNGGDGFCAARILAGWGFPVRIVHVGKESSLKGDARINYNLAVKFGLDIVTVESENNLNLLKSELERCEWIIDALFGTGLNEPVRGTAEKALEIASASGKRCAAVDIPSGISSDTGEKLGSVIKADLTVTFGLPKWGHFIFPGVEYRGKLVVADIGFPSFLTDSDEFRNEIISPEMVRNLLPVKLLGAHKSTAGRLAVLGGSRNLLGAAVMAGKSAIRAGTGYVTLLIPYSLELFAKAVSIELVTMGLPDDGEGYFTENAGEKFFQQTENDTALAVGPGLGKKEYTGKFIIEILKKNKLPSVIDADALNILAHYQEMDFNMSVPWVLTPHPAEAARLLQVRTSDILKNPVISAKEIAEKYHAVVVLKGAHTLVVNPEGKVYVNPTGNPVLAVMGTGDILTGIIGSMLARGIEPFRAASAGVFIHGLMGDLAAYSISGEGLIPPDMIDFIPLAIENIRRGEVKTGVGIIK